MRPNPLFAERINRNSPGIKELNGFKTMSILRPGRFFELEIQGKKE